MMNVTFTAPDKALDEAFCAGAQKEGLVNIKGHRLVGGMRASITTPCPTRACRRW
jgi:phosphoserine aminotransferase